MKDVLNITRFDGESALISNEDKPGYLFSKIENLRPNVKIGSAVKRKPYTAIPSLAYFSSIQTMKEFMDKNGTYTLVVIGDYGIAVYKNTSGVYSSQSYTDNNGGTIDGSEATLMTYNGTIRAGVGLSTSGNGDIPIWYGYIEAATRYNGAGTVAADNYMEEQFPEPTAFSFDIGQTSSYVTGKNVATGLYRLYASVVIDGYQRKILPLSYTEGFQNVTSTTSTIKGLVQILTSDVNDLNKVSSRITAIDIFVGYLSEPLQEAYGDKYNDNIPGYFLERIELGERGDYIITLDGTLDSTLQEITIADYANWHTFSPNYGYFRDETNNKDYYVLSSAISGSDMVFTIGTEGDAIDVANDGDTVELKFYFDWATNGSYEQRYFVFDDTHKKLGSEMYEYLNTPLGDLGLDDFKYNYLASNGDTFLYSGLSDSFVSYFSVVGSPDVVPAQNIIKHRAAVRGVSNVGQDFIVFTDIGVERIRLTGDTGSYKDQEYSDAILTSNRAFYKPNDDTILFMSYNGPAMIIGDKIDTSIGWHLREWWLDIFSASELESCVVGYNLKEDEAYFSFPDYSDSNYPNGIVFVFDFKAFKVGNQSPWWRIKSDMIFKAFAINSQQNLLVASNTEIVDFNTPGTDENVSTSLKIKVINNPAIGSRMRFDTINVEKDGDDSVTVNTYMDDSSTVTKTPTLDADGTAYIRYVAKNMSVGFDTSGSTNELEYKRIQVTHKAMRK